jgi:hypothetical protein
MSTEKSQKNATFFECLCCDYISYNKFDYNKHIKTIKHLNNQIQPNSIKSRQKSQEHIYTCNNCNKSYTDKSGLWRHKKKCICDDEQIEEQSLVVIDNQVDFKELFKMQMNENKELKEMIIEQNKFVMEICKEKSIGNNNNINSNNKTFNLQFFLNETCKDAMNMSEFIDSMKLQLSDLESVGKLGFVDGISNIIINSLKALDVEKRPVHCSDAKRETMYIKDHDKWEREDNEFNKMKDMVRKVRDKNISLINSWRDLYPECLLSNSKKTGQFNEICMESFGGEKGTKQEKEEKIISKIAKSVIIDKEKE